MRRSEMFEQMLHITRGKEKARSARTLEKNLHDILINVDSILNDVRESLDGFLPTPAAAATARDDVCPR